MEPGLRENPNDLSIEVSNLLHILNVRVYVRPKGRQIKVVHAHVYYAITGLNEIMMLPHKCLICIHLLMHFSHIVIIIVCVCVCVCVCARAWRLRSTCIKIVSSPIPPPHLFTSSLPLISSPTHTQPSQHVNTVSAVNTMASGPVCI